MQKSLVYLLVSISLLLSFQGCTDQENCLSYRSRKTATETDLKNHPIYKQYSFSSEAAVVDIGTQPLWLPVANIVEFIKRDPLLKQSLDTLGVRLVFHDFLKGDDVNFFLHSGDLELGIGGDMPALVGLAHDDLQVFSLFQEGSVAMVAHKDAVGDFSSLKTSKIGYAPGSNAFFYLLNTLRKLEISDSEVHLVPMEVTEMTAAINQGCIDFFAAWEPTPSIAVRNNPDLAVIHRGKSFGFLYGSSRLASRNPEIIKQLLASEIRALHWMRQNKQNLTITCQWATGSRETFAPARETLPLTMLTTIAKQDLPGIRIREYPRVPLNLIEQNGKLKMEFDILKKLGFIPKQTEWSNIRFKFNNQLIDAVISEPEKYHTYLPIDMSE
ncbi:MAG: ABC transporter substrate-binding protein [Desulfobulbaceae bacterium]|nr:ABC transporter substrate-binding protein [Desulfobulbaceae bacterium]